MGEIPPVKVEPPGEDKAAEKDIVSDQYNR
jgi:hypothetical protein